MRFYIKYRSQFGEGIVRRDELPMNSPDDSEGPRSGEGARVDVDASLTDLRLLLEMKLVNVGYRLGPRLQLLLDSYVVSGHASSSSWLAAQQGAKIFVGAHEAHLAAFYALGDVLLLQALPEADGVRAARSSGATGGGGFARDCCARFDVRQHCARRTICAPHSTRY